ncbi:MAG: MFS transporter [Desulfobacterales bacterium]|jgi:MFS family permease|nr:MFS transporter [Desulfobacterales bacterium]
MTARPGSSGPLGIVGLMCLAETLSMTGFATYPAFLALLRDAWGLTNSEAGFIGGAYFAGYMAAVPVLSSLTDRFDARRIHILSCLLAAASNIGFSLAAGGMVTAALFQALAGAGLGGTYMPGLKALTDRVGGPRQSRYIAFYTATFGIGTSLSLLLAGWLGGAVGWRWVFTLLAMGPLAAALIVFFALRPHPPPPRATETRSLLRFDGALRERGVRRFIRGYAVHCWELFGLRSWMVAFILFAYGLQSSAPAPISATAAAALINLFGIPVSILGNEAAGRIGRQRYIAWVMGASGLLAWLAGFSAGWEWWVVLLLVGLYFVAVMSDSAALTAGLVAATPLERRGSAMALYSFSGFGAGFVAPLVFGVVLDLAGGKEAPLAWTLAFGSLGLGCLATSLVSWLEGSSRRR